MNRVHFRQRVGLALGIVVFLAAPLPGEDWSHWRGNNRNDITSELSNWGKEGVWPLKKPMWTAEVGVGCTSPLIVEGKVYAMGWTSDNKDHVYCLDANNGKIIWEQRYNAPQYGRHSVGDKSVYAGPSSTPEYDSETGYLYTLGLDGDLNCWDTTKKGKQVWSLNLYDKYRAPKRPQVNRSGRRDYGYTTSPIVYENFLIIEVGASQGNLMGFDKKTGKQLWTSKSSDPAGHNGGPALMMVEGVPCVAVLHHNGLLVVRLDKGHEGEEVATYPWLTEWANNIAAPAVYKNFVIITSAYNKKAMCKVEITLKGARKVWENSLMSKACTPIIHKGCVYWVWRSVHCVDFETGKQKWEIRTTFGDPGSCIVTADERLIVWGRKGKLLLAETAERSPNEGKILYVNERVTRADAWPHLALADGKLLCKDRYGVIKTFSLK